jgi:hypothetical protein
MVFLLSHKYFFKWAEGAVVAADWNVSEPWCKSRTLDGSS